MLMTVRMLALRQLLYLPQLPQLLRLLLLLLQPCSMGIATTTVHWSCCFRTGPPACVGEGTSGTERTQR